MNKLDVQILIKIYTLCNKSNKNTNILEFFNNASKPVFLIIYGFAVVYLYFSNPYILPTFIFYPFALLVLNIALRKIIKRKRPFENKDLNFKNIGKSTSYSMPSNHASSSIVISLFLFYVNPIVAVFSLFLAIITSFLRVARGYHYPFDILISLVLAILFFYFSQLCPIVL